MLIYNNGNTTTYTKSNKLSNKRTSKGIRKRCVELKSSKKLTEANALFLKSLGYTLKKNQEVTT